MRCQPWRPSALRGSLRCGYAASSRDDGRRRPFRAEGLRQHGFLALFPRGVLAEVVPGALDAAELRVVFLAVAQQQQQQLNQRSLV